MSMPHQAVLQEVAAPAGWTAMLLPHPLPAETTYEAETYRDTVEELLAVFAVFDGTQPEECLLVFERMRPDMEITTMQDNARLWSPEFGMGVWLDSAPPTTWTKEEFEEAAPGTLRPVVERVVRIRQDLRVQQSCWQMLGGTGAVIRLCAPKPNRVVEESTQRLQPTISDRSLTSFPFYVPLLRAGTLTAPSFMYDEPLEEFLPGVTAYARESVEDGGLLLLLRRPPAQVRAHLQKNTAFHLRPLVLPS